MDPPVDSDLLTCYNKGCLQKFDPVENGPEACTHHSEEPYFHDGYKIWTCCDKKFRDFTSFLDCKGCKKGPHNPTKPPEKEKPKPSSDEPKEITYSAPKPASAAPRPTRDAPLEALPVTIGPSLQQLLDSLSLESAQNGDTPAQTENGNGDCEVKPGELCKRNACGISYSGPDSLTETCLYHPGTAIFHEGMKFWSCCQRKTSDFDAFMNQEGCTRGKHAWTNEAAGKKLSACRYDWHQTGTLVVVTIYAKFAHPHSCSIRANRVTLDVALTFGKDASETFELTVPLWGAIRMDSSSVKMLGSKVEIDMRKADPVYWKDLTYRSED